MLDAVAKLFPRFARKVGGYYLEHVLPPASAADLVALERRLGLPLPESYKALLRCTGGFWLMGGVVQFGEQHLFIHDFPPLDTFNPEQQRRITLKGGPWPAASQGMLCFAEFWLEADGDQVLFDTSRGLIGGEYPIMYYAHEGRPPSVRRLADGFGEFMETFLDYPEFTQDEGV